MLLFLEKRKKGGNEISLGLLNLGTQSIKTDTTKSKTQKSDAKWPTVEAGAEFPKARVRQNRNKYARHSGRGWRVKILKEICRAQAAMTGDKVRRVRGQVSLELQYGTKPLEEQQQLSEMSEYNSIKQQGEHGAVGNQADHS